MLPHALRDLPPPEPEALAVAEALAARIRAEIDAGGGAIPFERYMELALYAPGLGYYSAGAPKFGAAGDFVTAPELSALFSRCLARQCAQALEALDGGEVLEFGAGSGAMAAEVLAELEALGRLPQRYRILELSAALRQRQRETLAARVPQLLERIEWLDALPEGGLRGVVLGNEVLDAMPVCRFRVAADGPRELAVGHENGRLVWRERPLPAARAGQLAAIERELPAPLPEGYVSEFNPWLAGWLQGLAGALEAGLVLLIDYGYPRREFYHPERSRGTLICHYRHRAHEDALLWPGLQDITANVDFSALADAALEAGFELEGYASQAYFLFGCGLEALLAELDPTDTLRWLETTRQVKLLTLPGEMGERFKAIGLGKALPCRPRGFALFDERGRL